MSVVYLHWFVIGDFSRIGEKHGQISMTNLSTGHSHLICGVGTEMQSLAHVLNTQKYKKKLPSLELPPLNNCSALPDLAPTRTRLLSCLLLHVVDLVLYGYKRPSIYILC